MELSEIKGRHVASIQSLLQSLTTIYPGIDENQDQMLVRLAMLHHDEDPTNMARADELLDSSALVYVQYTAPMIDLHSRMTSPTMAADGATATVTLPESSQEATIRPLTGREWRLGLTDSQRMNRTAIMAGMTVEECGELSLLDYLTLEAATTPFLSEVLAALMIGSDLSQPLSETALDSGTSTEVTSET